VHIVGCFATVDVWRVPHHVRGGYDEVIDRLREEQRQLPG
jgi:hypothetical protein